MAEVFQRMYSLRVSNIGTYKANRSGGSSAFDGAPIVERSISLNQPIVFVSLNYRFVCFSSIGGNLTVRL